MNTFYLEIKNPVFVPFFITRFTNVSLGFTLVPFLVSFHLGKFCDLNFQSFSLENMDWSVGRKDLKTFHIFPKMTEYAK